MAPDIGNRSIHSIPKASNLATSGYSPFDDPSSKYGTEVVWKQAAHRRLNQTAKPRQHVCTSSVLVWCKTHRNDEGGGKDHLDAINRIWLQANLSSSEIIPTIGLRWTPDFVEKSASRPLTGRSLPLKWWSIGHPACQGRQHLYADDYIMVNPPPPWLYKHLNPIRRQNLLQLLIQFVGVAEQNLLATPW